MPRSEQEIIKENIELSTEFSKYLFDNPEVKNRIPPDSEIILLPEFDEELKDYNLQLGKKLEADGTKVAYVKIGKLNPKVLSRIEGVHIDLIANVWGGRWPIQYVPLGAIVAPDFLYSRRQLPFCFQFLTLNPRIWLRDAGVSLLIKLAGSGARGGAEPWTLNLEPWTLLNY